MASKTQTIVHERMSCSTWSEYFGPRSPDIDIDKRDEVDIDKREDESSKSFSSKLREVDMAIYGLCPLWEICSLPICGACGKIVKLQSMKSHMVSHGVTQPPPNLEPTSLKENEVVILNLSNEQTSTHGAKSTAIKQSIRNNNHVDDNQSSQEISDHNFSQENKYLSYNKANSSAFVQHKLPYQDVVPSTSTQLTLTEKAVINNFQNSVTIKEMVTKGYRKSGKKGSEYNPDVHCGVQNKDTGKRCTCLIICKKHSVTLKRLVPGRSKTYNQLVQDYKTQSAKNKVALLTNNAATVIEPNSAKSLLLNQGEAIVNHKPAPVITFLSSVPPKSIVNGQDKSLVLGHLQNPDFDAEQAKSKEIDQVKSNHHSTINLLNNVTIGNSPSIHRLEAAAAIKPPESQKENLLTPLPVIISKLKDTRTEPIITRMEPTNRIEPIARTDTTNNGMGPKIDSFSRVQRRLDAAIRSEPNPVITDDDDDPPYICRPPRPSAVCTYGIRQDRGILLLNQRSNRLKASLEALLPVESSSYHPYFKKFCVKSPVVEPVAIASSSNLCSKLTVVSSAPKSIPTSSVTSHNISAVRTESTTSPVLFPCISTEDRTLPVPQSNSKVNIRTNKAKAYSESSASMMYLPQTLRPVPNGVSVASHLIPNHVENSTLQLTAATNFQFLDNIQFPISLATNPNIIRNPDLPHHIHQAPNGQMSSGFNIRELLKDTRKINVPTNYSAAQTFGATSSTGHLPYLQPQPSQTLLPYSSHLHTQTHAQSNTSIAFQKKKSGRTAKSKPHRNSAPYILNAEDKINSSPMSGHFPTIQNGFPPSTQSFFIINQLPVSPNSNPATDQSSSESTNSVQKEGKGSSRLLLPSNLKIAEAVCINGWISASTRVPAAP